MSVLDHFATQSVIKIDLCIYVCCLSCPYTGIIMCLWEDRESLTKPNSNLSSTVVSPYTRYFWFCLQGVDLTVDTPDIRIGSRSYDGLPGACQ